MKRIFASIEARMGSSRFPGKMLANVFGQPALVRLIRRLKQCRRLEGIVLATTVAAADDALAECAAAEGIATYRGSEDDVLHRVVEAQRSVGSEVVVEVTGDCTLLDPALIDWGVDLFFENDCDVVTNVRKVSFPMGQDIQVFPFAKLADVERQVSDPCVREHVSVYFYEHPEIYRVFHLLAPPRWHAPHMRCQLDYPEDHQFITELYRRLEPIHGPCFGLEEVISLVRREPALAEINRHCVEKAAR